MGKSYKQTVIKKAKARLRYLRMRYVKEMKYAPALARCESLPEKELKLFLKQIGIKKKDLKEVR